MYPDLGPKLQPRPYSGIELSTLCFEGGPPTNWATMVRACSLYLIKSFLFVYLFCSVDSTYKWYKLFVFLCLELISLGIIPSRSVHAVTNGMNHKWFHSFLWSSNILLYICTTTFFIHLAINGHLGCFHILALVNNVSRNMRVHMYSYFWISVLGFFGYMPRSEITRS